MVDERRAHLECQGVLAKKELAIVKMNTERISKELEFDSLLRQIQVVLSDILLCVCVRACVHVFLSRALSLSFTHTRTHTHEQIKHTFAQKK